MGVKRRQGKTRKCKGVRRLAAHRADTGGSCSTYDGATMTALLAGSRPQSLSLAVAGNAMEMECDAIRYIALYGNAVHCVPLQLHAQTGGLVRTFKRGTSAAANKFFCAPLLFLFSN